MKSPSVIQVRAWGARVGAVGTFGRQAGMPAHQIDQIASQFQRL